MKKVEKVLAILLMLSLVIGLIPMKTFALLGESLAPIPSSGIVQDYGEQQVDGDNNDDNCYTVGEIVEKRTADTKTFLLSNGSLQAITYNSNVHFKNSDDKWEDYDNSLVEDTDDNSECDYVNQKSDMSVRLSKKTNGKKFVRVEKDGYKLSWYYTNANKVTGSVINNKHEGSGTDILDNVTSQVIYYSVYNNVDLRYTVAPDTLKEDLILNSADVQTEFVSEYKCNGLTAAENDDGTISLSDQNSKVIYVLAAPYMTDAAGAISENVTLKLVSQKNGKFTVKTTIDKEWITAENRKFPIVVDPYIDTNYYVDNGNIETTYISSGMPNTAYRTAKRVEADGKLYAGYINSRRQVCRPMVKIKDSALPDIGIAGKVTDARFTVSVPQCYRRLELYAHGVISNVDYETVTWNNNVEIMPAPADYNYVPRNTSFSTDRMYTYEITDLVRRWYQSDLNNNGIMFLSNSEHLGDDSYAIMLISGSQASTVCHAVFTVTYRNMSGYENYWSYTNVDSTDKGVVSVNNYNGNLVMSQQISCDDNTSVMPLEISLIYNSNIKTYDRNLYLGRGMSINYNARFGSVDSQLSSSGYTYYLRDTDGTTHYFLHDEQQQKDIDEDGLGYTVIPAEDKYSASYAVSDKSGSKMYFDSNGNLRAIENSAGLATVINRLYDGSGGSIVSPNNQATFHDREVAYINGEQVIKPSHLYMYGSSDVGAMPASVCPFAFNDNNELIIAGDIIFDYTDGLLTKITKDNYVTEIQYDYTGQKRVKSLTKKNGNTVIEKYTFNYLQNQTEVTDIQNRTVTYQFNDKGQTTGIISNVTGQAKFYEYTGNSSTNKANKILQESTAVSSVVNYIRNPMVADNIDDYYIYTTGETGAYEGVLDNSRGNTQNGSLKISKESLQGKVFGIQEYNLNAGTYTLSAFINTGNAALSGRGAHIGVEEWYDNACTAVHWVETVKETNDSWERDSATFTVSDGCMLKVILGLDIGTSGTVWIDDIQLEKSAGPTNFNLVENGGFTEGSRCWDSDNYSPMQPRPDCDLLSFDKCALIREISTRVDENGGFFTQTINVSGNAGDEFTFGGWTKGNSLPVDNGIQRNENPLRQPKYNINITYYTDDSNTAAGCIEAQYNTDLHGDLYGEWQFVSAGAKIPVNYTKIKITVSYLNNTGACYSTGIFCYKQQFGNKYNYTDDGNLNGVEDKTQAASRVGNLDDMAVISTNPTGSRIMYSYTDGVKQRVNVSLSSDGVETKYGYDEQGNQISSALSSRKPVTNLENGKSYFIMNAYSGQMLDSGLNPDTCRTTTFRYDVNAPYQRWKLISTEETDVYLLQSVAFPTYYLDVDNGYYGTDGTEIKVYPRTGSEQFYKVKHIKDGRFIIYTKASQYNYALASYDNINDDNIEYSQKVRQISGHSTDNEKFLWYFYPTDFDTEEKITTSSVYQKGRLMSETDQMGNTTVYAYQQKPDEYSDYTYEMPTSVTYADGNYTHYWYDNEKRLTSVTDSIGRVEYTYDNRNNITSVNNYKFTYNAFDSMLSVKYNSKPLVQNTYNNYGLLTQQKYANNYTVNYEYDALEKITGKVYNGSRRVDYSYDSDGRLTFVKDPAAERFTKYSYDSCGRIIGTSVFKDAEMRYDILAKSQNTYENKTGRLLNTLYSFVAMDAAKLSAKLGYVYGSNTDSDRVLKVTHNGADMFGYNYGNFGRLMSFNYLGINGTARSTNYGYAANGNNTTTIVNSVENSGFAPLVYTYNSRGNISAVSEGETRHSYTYNNRNMLTGSTHGNDVYEYTYDENGNILSKSKNGNQFATYGYNNSEWPDLLTSFNGEEITYDASGNPLNYCGKKTFTWNGRQLSSVQDLKAYMFYDFAYDADGRRIRKSYRPSSEAEYITEYYYNGDTFIGENHQIRFRGDVVVNKKRIFLYDASGTVYGIEYYAGDATTPTEIRYLVRNLQGDVIGEYDETGAITATYTYDDWGNILSYTGDGSYNPFRYRGYYYDSETGFYYLNSRYYDPETGRFLNADCLISTSDLTGLNMFAYCGNNPVNMSDSSGQLPKWIKNTVKWIAKNIVKPVVKTVQKTISKVDLTYSTGFNVSGTPSAWIFNGQIGISMDTKGDFAIQASGGGGITGGSPGISITRYQSITNAPNIDKLNDEYYQAGGSIAVPIGGFPVAAGGDVMFMPDSERKTRYLGLTGNAGLGTPGTEFHVEWGTTVTLSKTQFNIYEIARSAYIKIMEW